MDEDPWHWDLNRVLDFFRNEMVACVKDRPNSLLPDLNPFLQALQEHDVAGSTLLDTVDATFLRQDCGIKSLGMRGTIIYCISNLRKRSKFVGAHDTYPQLATPASMADAPPSLNLPQTPLPVAQQESLSNLRAGEVEVEDGRGRKRRKLDMMAASQQLKATESGREVVPRPNSSLPSSRPQIPRDNNAFLSDAGIPVDELFYGQTAIGQEIKELSANADVVDGMGSDADGFNYEYWSINLPSQRKPAGEVAFANRCLQRFFQNDEQRVIKRGDRKAIAILPYSEEFAVNGRATSATVLRWPTSREIADAVELGGDRDMTSDSEPEPKIVRENAAYLDVEVDYSGIPANTATGEWDFLVTKHRDDEMVLPEYGESEQSITSSLDREIEADAAEDSDEETPTHLSKTEIEKVIDECIEDIATRWREKKLPQLAKREWTFWKQTRRSRSRRDALIEGARSIIELLNQRLQKQKRELLRDEWLSDGKKLREMCEIMSATLDDKQEHEWKIRIWQKKQEPQHAIHHSRHASKKTEIAHVSNSDGFVVGPDDRLSMSPAPGESSNELEDAYHNSQAGDSGDLEQAPGADGAAGDDEMSADENETASEFIDDGDVIQHDAPIQSNAVIAASPSGGKPCPVTPPRERPQVSSDQDSSSLPDGSTFLRNSQRVKAEQAVRIPAKQKVIEISSDSTPASSSKRTKASTWGPELSFQGDPLLSLASEVKRWEIGDLVRETDRMRLVIKLLFMAGREDREKLQDCFKRKRKVNFIEHLLDALRDLRTYRKDIGADSDAQTMIFTAKLYLTHYYLRPAIMQDAAVLKDGELVPLLHNKAQADLFVNVLAKILMKLDSPLFNQRKPSTGSGPGPALSKYSIGTARFAGYITSGSEDESVRGSAIGISPSKKRGKKKKRKVELGALAAQSQHQAFDRQNRFNEMQAQASNSQELTTIVSMDASHSHIVINVLKDGDQDNIYVDKKIAQSMKDHQISGVQFLWREITATGEDGAQGCILAHTMGLGKTMQLITLLVALNEATLSENPGVNCQLPENLRLAGREGRQLRVLVLCPPSLLENWRNEIRRWAGKKLSNVVTIDTGNAKQHMPLMNDWFKEGGIMLIGYDLFRNKVNNKRANDQEKAESAAETQRYLLKGPEIVVADEAHNLKNEKSGISQVARRFQTESRIALTGTPMSNDVREIYSLVSFVAPDYFGDAKYFNAHFAKPIREGNRRDASNTEYRRGLKKLAVLHRKIEPKVNRANITVLRGSLSSKTEFVVFVPLLDIQHQTYLKYTKAVLGDSNNDKASQTRIFGWLSVLTLLTAHPLAFKRKLFAPPRNKSRRLSREVSPATSDSGTATPATATPADDSDIDEGAAIRTLGFSDETVRAITSDICDDIDRCLSAKMSVLLDIVNLSKSASDKLLAFSHSLGTLDYIEELFQASGIRYGRIDGNVKVSTRLELIKQLDSDKCDVLIISTRAGNVGLNIQSANRVVILDFGFNPTYEEQAIGRAYRLGQQKPVFVYRFVVDGTFESHIYDRQMFKTALASRVVDKKNMKRSADGVSRDMLHPPQEVPQCEVESFLENDEFVLARILKQQLQRAQSPGYTTLIRRLDTMETLTREVVDVPLDEEEKKEVEEEYQQGFLTGRGRKSAAMFAGAMPPPMSTAPSVSRGQGRPLPSSAPFQTTFRIGNGPSRSTAQTRPPSHADAGVPGRPSLNVRLTVPADYQQRMEQQRAQNPMPQTGHRFAPSNNHTSESTAQAVPHGLPMSFSTAPPAPR